MKQGFVGSLTVGVKKGSIPGFPAHQTPGSHLSKRFAA